MGKKKGKKKKSKEELEAERVAKEEEERIAAEAEAARLAEEKRIAEEEARKKAEEAATARKAELERLDAEHEAAKEDDGAHSAAVQSWSQQLEEKEEWERYRASDGSFDISQESMLNAFLSDVQGGEYTSLEAGVAAAASIIELLTQLESKKQKNFEVGDAGAIASSCDICARFEKAVAGTLDTMMAKVVDGIKARSKNKPELQESMTSEFLDVGLWMNVVPKGYRPRIVKFDDMNCSVTIPRNLMSLNLATTTQIFKRSWETSRLAPAVGEGPAEPLSDAAKELVNKRAEQLHEAWRAKRALPDGTFKPRNTRINGKVEDMANLPFAELSDANKQQFLQEAEFVERWLASINAAADFTSYGPVLRFELIDLPAQSRQLKRWLVSEVQEGQEGKVTHRTYPLEGTPAGQVVPPIKFSLTIPENVIVHAEEQPQVAVWSPETRQWTTEAVSEVSYAPETRLLKFQAVAVGYMSMVQPRSVDIPLQFWEVKQLNFKGALRLTLRTARGHSISIKIHDDGCSLILVADGEHPTPQEVRHLVRFYLNAIVFDATRCVFICF